MKSKIFVKVLFGCSLLLLLGSCGVNSYVMFKTPKGTAFKYDSIPMRPNEDYKLTKDDKFTFILYPNSGEKLIESLTGTTSSKVAVYTNANSQLISALEYTIRSDGNVDLPILGLIKAEGLSVYELQDTLRKKYSNQYNNPFVKVEVTNKRCVVFSGEGSLAKVMPLLNDNTTLMEIIAQSGGISARGQSKLVKVMRKVGEKREVYLIDLSNINGLGYADMIIQGNDYIYIEPKPQLAQELLREVSPIISIISSLFVITRIIQTSK